MPAFARSAGRAPSVIGFMLLSLAVHLAVLRGASLPGWLAPKPAEPPPVAVSLIEAPPPVAATAPVEAAAPTPQPAVAKRRRVARTQKPPVAPKPAAPAQADAPPVADAVAPIAMFDAFGRPIAEAPSVQVGDGPAPDNVPPGGDVGSASGTQLADSLPAPDGGTGGAGEVEARPAGATAEVAIPAPPIVVTPQAGTARYRVHFGDPAERHVVAILEHSFEIGPDRYRLHSEGRAQGLTAWFYRGALVQDSVGTVSAAGLSPSSYREQRGDRPPRSASIDAQRREVVFGSGVRREAPPGVQDRLSALVQLALLRQSRPELFGPGAVVELPMVASSKVETAKWNVLGEEPVATDAGTVPALRLTRRPAAGEDEPTVDLWLALDARIVPLRVRITEINGRALDQVIVAQ